MNLVEKLRTNMANLHNSIHIIENIHSDCHEKICKNLDNQIEGLALVIDSLDNFKQNKYSNQRSMRSNNLEKDTNLVSNSIVNHEQVQNSDLEQNSRKQIQHQQNQKIVSQNRIPKIYKNMKLFNKHGNLKGMLNGAKGKIRRNYLQIFMKNNKTFSNFKTKNIKKKINRFNKLRPGRKSKFVIPQKFTLIQKKTGSKNFQVNNNQVKLASQFPNFYNQLAVNYLLSFRNINSFKFKILTSRYADILIGITPRNHSDTIQRNYVAYYGKFKMIVNNTKNCLRGQGFRQGDIVKVVLKNKRIYWYVNQIQQASAYHQFFQDQGRAYAPFVQMNTINDIIQWIPQ